MPSNYGMHHHGSMCRLRSGGMHLQYLWYYGGAREYPPPPHHIYPYAPWHKSKVGRSGNILYKNVGHRSRSYTNQQKSTSAWCMPLVRVTLLPWTQSRDYCMWLNNTQATEKVIAIECSSPKT